MTKYAVTTPEFTHYTGGLDEPNEMGYGYCEVEADSPRQAKVEAVRHFRTQVTQYPGERSWAQEAKDNNANPFTGLVVEEIDDDCNG